LGSRHIPMAGVSPVRHNWTTGFPLHKSGSDIMLNVAININSS
jgi:hypothetical protein